MKNHRKSPPAADDACPEPSRRACPEPSRRACPEPGRRAEPFDDDFEDELQGEEPLPERWRNWNPADRDAPAPWHDPPDPDREPIPEPFVPPLHPPEFPGLSVGGIVPDPATSGFYYISGKPVPPTHPDHGPMHLLPRRPDGGFAAYYYCSKAELQAWEIDHPPPLRYRHDGFTPEKIAIFIRTLRATASVTAAARAAGISRKTAYDLYNREDAAFFRQAWDEALRGPNIVLTSTAYDRAVNGVEEAVWYKGEFKGWRVRHDNRLLMWLLRVRDPLNFAPLDDLQGWLRHRDVEPHVPIEPIVDRLEQAERAWERRLPGSEAAPAFPDAEARRRAALEEARDPDPPAPPPMLPDGRSDADQGED